MSRIAAVLLAAGGSRRFGDDSKLMADLGGRPVVDHAAAAIESADLGPRVAAVRPGDAAVRAVVEARGFETVENPRADEGMGTSIAAGAVWAADRDADGLMVCLGDAPFVTPDTLTRLAEACAAHPASVAVVTRDGPRRGSPTVFGRDHFDALRALDGDQGGRSILAAHPDAIVEVRCATPGELDDVDTPEALEAARRRLLGS